MLNRLQILAGIQLNELNVNNPNNGRYFNQWKQNILDHMVECCSEDDMYCDLIEDFKNINEKYEAIEYLVDNEYLMNNDEDRDGSEYFIKNGKFPN